MTADTIGCAGAVDVFVVRLDVDPARLAAYATTLSPDERARADRLHTETDRRRAIVARGALRAILAEVLGVAPSVVPLTVARGGKPELGGRLSGRLAFNLSRRDDLAAVAVCDDGQVGIDIEPLHEVPDLDEVVALVCNDAEVARLPVAGRSAAVLGMWTAKEAFLKATGAGLRTDPREVTVDLRSETIGQGWYLQPFEPAPGWTGAVVRDRAAPHIVRHG